jgi:hypothetical protein
MGWAAWRTGGRSSGRRLQGGHPGLVDEAVPSPTPPRAREGGRSSLAELAVRAGGGSPAEPICVWGRTASPRLLSRESLGKGPQGACTLRGPRVAEIQTGRVGVEWGWAAWRTGGRPPGRPQAPGRTPRPRGSQRRGRRADDRREGGRLRSASGVKLRGEALPHRGGSDAGVAPVGGQGGRRAEPELLWRGDPDRRRGGRLRQRQGGGGAVQDSGGSRALSTVWVDGFPV